MPLCSERSGMQFDPLDLFQRYEEQRASLNAEIGRVLAEITAHLGDGRKDE